MLNSEEKSKEDEFDVPERYAQAYLFKLIKKEKEKKGVIPAV